jgi:hypothetical protein
LARGCPRFRTKQGLALVTPRNLRQGVSSHEFPFGSTI